MKFLKQACYALIFCAPIHTCAAITTKQATDLLNKSGVIARQMKSLKSLPNEVIKDFELEKTALSEEEKNKFIVLPNDAIASMKLNEKLINFYADTISEEDYKTLMSWYNQPKSEQFVEKYITLIDKEGTVHFKDTEKLTATKAQIEQAKLLITTLKIKDAYKQMTDHTINQTFEKYAEKFPMKKEWIQEQRKKTKEIMYEKIQKRVDTYYPRFTAYVYANISEKDKADYIQLLKLDAFQHFFTHRQANALANNMPASIKLHEIINENFN